jgi:hypothetical protein
MVEALVEFSIQYNLKVGWFANVSKAMKIAWEHFKRVTPTTALVDKSEVDHVGILNTGSTWSFYSLHEPDNVVGAGFDIAVIDEAARCTRYARDEVVGPMVADRNGLLILPTTPKGKKGSAGHVFRDYKHAKSGKEGYAFMQGPTWQNPLPAIQSWVDWARENLPSSVFKQEIEALFIEDASDLFSNWPACVCGKGEDPQRDVRYVAGIDLAKHQNWTVCVIMRYDGPKPRIVAMLRFQHIDWPEAVRRLRSFTRKYNNARSLVDQGEVGDAVISMMRKAGMKVDGVRIVGASKGRSKATKGVCQTIGRVPLLDGLAAAVADADIECPEELDAGPLGEEIRDFQVDLDEDGKTKYETRGDDDDTVFAAALCLENIPTTVPGKVLIGEVERTAFDAEEY